VPRGNAFEAVTAVLVSHPHVAAFAVGVASSLESEGKLSAFMTGFASRGEGWSGAAVRALAARHPVLRNRILTGLSASRLRPLPVVELGARLAARAVGDLRPRFKLYDALFTAHDLAVSLLPWPRETTAVYAYEDGALQTFGRARRKGLERIWDLPLPHYQTIEEILKGEFRRWPRAAIGAPHSEPPWKRRRKDAELALASKVSVASTFTKQSLERLDTDVPIVVAGYGFPIEEFQPRTVAPTGPFTVLSVGSHDLRKGTPYLLEAWRRAAIPDAELHLVGPLRLAKAFLEPYAGLFRHWPHVPKSELGRHYAGADLLAFPTLGDGFGLVIQEAMCTGTPVVTTPCGGGPDCITDGVDGWIVPPRDIDALVDRFRACAADRDRTHAIGRAARARAGRWTWRDTGAALIRGLEL
jgi:glycosyltransferase involved in cell wall biosynthesis